MFGVSYVFLEGAQAGIVFSDRRGRKGGSEGTSERAMAAQFARVDQMRRLARAGGTQLSLHRGARCSSESSCTLRSISFKFCSSSAGPSRQTEKQTWRCAPVPKSSGMPSLVSARASSQVSGKGVDSPHGKGIYSLTIKRVQSVDCDQAAAAAAGRNGGTAISSVPDGQEGVSGASEGSSSSDVARPQSVAKGDNPFKEFAMDLSCTAGAVGAGLAGMGSEFESMAVSLSNYQPKWIWFATSAEHENILVDKLINATIVGFAVVFALTKMLTVDHDYWHGWTIYEILQYAPVHNWFAYEELLRTHPVLAKMMISGTVYSLGDWIAQCYEGKSVLEFNRLRMLRSGLVGFCLHGSLSHFYYHFCEWLFPFEGWWVLPLKVGFDQTIWCGIWNSIYFTTVGLLRLDSPVNIAKELRQTFFPLLTAGWKLWPFAHIVTYGAVPVEQRLLWVDMVEIVWVTILAMYSNEMSEARLAEAEHADAVMVSNVDDAVDGVSFEANVPKE